MGPFSMFIGIRTNEELVLGNKDWMIAGVVGLALEGYISNSVCGRQYPFLIRI